MRRRIAATFSVLLALGLLAWIAARLDWAGTREVLGRAGLAGIGAFAAVSLLPLLIQAGGWLVLLRARGWKVPYRTALVSVLIGNAVGYIAPSLYLGGEPVKIWHMSRRLGVPSREVAATVISNKFAEFAGFLSSVLVCTGTMLWSFDLPRGLRWGSTGVAAALLLVFIVVFAAFVGRWPLVSGLLRILGKRGERFRAWAEHTEGLVEETFREHRAAFAVTLLLTGGSIAIVVLEPFVFFHFTGIHQHFPAVALIFVMTQVALAFHVTPGGLGVFEGGVIATFAMIGLGSREAAAYAAMMRLSDVLIVGAGIALAARSGMAGFLKGKTPDTEDAPGSH